MPWIKTQEGKEVFLTEEQLERMKSRAEAIQGPAFALHGCKRFSERDRFALYLQTGQKIEDSSQLKTYIKDNDMRVVEPGDETSKCLDAGCEARGDDYGKQIAEAKAAGKIPFVS